MTNIGKIEYAVQYMYFFKQLMSPEEYQEFLEDFMFLYKHKEMLDFNKYICKEFQDDLEQPLQEVYIDETEYHAPNFILKNTYDKALLEKTYQSFKILLQLITTGHLNEAFQFFDTLSYKK